MIFLPLDRYKSNIMLENWLSPLALDDILDGPLHDHQLGSHLRVYSDQIPDLRKAKIAFVGIGERDANAIRSELYRLSFAFPGLQCVDLGNLRKSGLTFVMSSLKELLDSRILPVLLANDPRYIPYQVRAFQEYQQLASWVVVDENVSYLPGSKEKLHYLNQVIDRDISALFHLAVLGSQSHASAPEALDFLDSQNFEYVRLGRARANLIELEPLVRDGDLMSFNLAALKSSEAPGQLHPSPSGFFSEEACQICRYAGMSDKLKAFGLFGLRQSRDRGGQTAQVAAQMLWYFLEGFYHRKKDFPASTNGLVEYIVDSKKLDYQITFWRSQRSGRWWMQVPVKTKKRYQRHRLIPCSYADYKLACQEELPERLLNAFRRFDGEG